MPLGVSPLPTVIGPGAVGDAGGGGSAFGAITWNPLNNMGVSGTLYLLPGEGAQSTTEYFALIAGPGTFTKLAVVASFSMSTDSVTFTLRINGIDTGLIVTLAPGTTSAVGLGSVAVFEGDRVSIKMVQSGTQVSGMRCGIGAY